MKILLMSLNSKFIHANLAIHSIKQYYDHYKNSDMPEVTVKEYTINNDMDHILRDLVKGGYTHIFASAYIWNIDQLSILFSNYVKVKQETQVIFGGPEVTYDAIGHLKNKAFLKAVILGEGESTFVSLVENIMTYGDEGYSKTEGVAHHSPFGPMMNRPRDLIMSLDRIPFPYADLTQFDNRILYYESSRGCPYNCSYCLSSAAQGVRMLSLERVYEDMTTFLDANVQQVKFVDRTFNAIKHHALGIMRYLAAHDNGVTNFHFEITGTLLDEDYFELLSTVRPGLFQFEVGIQTTYEPTMKAINRPIPFEKLKHNCQRILSTGNIHLHVDLIAGLPYESFEQFLKSFDDVYSIGAEQVQLGFLKILKGTSIAEQKAEHGYVVREEAPYEVLENQYISFSELSKLKEIEALVEYYHNSGKFKHTLEYLLKNHFSAPSAFYLDLSRFYEAQGLFDSPVGTYRLYETLFEYSETLKVDIELIRDLLKYDYYYANLKGDRELFYYEEIPGFNHKRLLLLKEDSFQQNSLGISREDAKNLLKSVTFITLKYDIIALIESGYGSTQEQLTIVMFDYRNKARTNTIKISTELFTQSV